jgi:hypothetical protein
LDFADPRSRAAFFEVPHLSAMCATLLLFVIVFAIV